MDSKGILGITEKSKTDIMKIKEIALKDTKPKNQDDCVSEAESDGESEEEKEEEKEEQADSIAHDQ